MKRIVVYKSKTGFTKRYAEWIAEALDCPALPYEQFEAKRIKDYDLILYGSRIHIGKIVGLAEFKRLMGENPNTKLLVFATGATSAGDQDAVDTMWKANLSEAEQASLPHFYLQAGLCYEKMGAGDHFLLKGLSKMLSRQKEKTTRECGFAASIASSHDASSKELIAPLIAYIAGMGE